jgi:hypothetical protein
MPNAARAGWYDCETGIYYNRARYYHPNLGRYLERDPKEQALVLFRALAMNAQSRSASAALDPAGQFADGPHLYQFVGSNPIMYHDPDGMQALLLERKTSAAMMASLATLGLVGTHGLIGQIAELTANIAGYQAASALATADIDLGLAFGSATSEIVGVMAYLEVASRATIFSAAAAGTAIVSTGVLQTFDLAVFSMSQADALKRARGLAKQIMEHAGKVASGDPGDWGSGPDHWIKEMRNWLSKIKLRPMGGKTRPPWEDWIQRTLRWLENPKGPPPAAPT